MYDPETNQQLYMIMHRNPYGALNAARNYMKKRDAFIEKAFNKDSWTCKPCIMDPCTFLIERDNKRAWLLAFAGDICASEDPAHAQMIFDTMNAEWQCKEAPTSFMLGVKSQLADDGGIKSMNMSMEAYAEGMYNAFSQHVPLKTIHTPCDPSLILSLTNDSIQAEHKRVLERGYQRAVGMLLWAGGGVYPECLYTTGQLCKVMSKPTEQAWKTATKLIAYMHEHKAAGITYHSNGNRIPFLMLDASNKGGPSDSKRAYGLCGIWMGGPIIAVPKKLEHSSSATAANTAANGYMAISHTAKYAVWLRQLLVEMDLRDLVSNPTPILADDTAANQWVKDDKMVHAMFDYSM